MLIKSRYHEMIKMKEMVIYRLSIKLWTKERWMLDFSKSLKNLPRTKELMSRREKMNKKKRRSKTTSGVLRKLRLKKK